MFSNFITKVCTFTLAAGLNIDQSSEQELTEMFAEVASDDFPEVPSINQDSGESLCEFWEEYQDWDLKGLCNDGLGTGQDLKDIKTIDELKTMAIDNEYDGFSMFTDGRTGKAWHDDVFFKRCPKENENPLLSHAMTKRTGVKLYLRVAHPCLGQIEQELDE